ALAPHTFRALKLLDVMVPLLVELDRTGLLVDVVVTVDGLFTFLRPYAALEAGNQLVDGGVQLGAVLGGDGNEQRGARLVDEDGDDLVDYVEVQLEMALGFEWASHDVA